MSNSNQQNKRAREDPQLVGSYRELKRKRTWETGTSSTANAASKARGRLRGAVSKILVKKGTFNYQNLASEDEIRILRVLKGQLGSDIHCTLIPVLLPIPGNSPSTSTAKKIPYEALSYWWGNDDATKKIWISIYDDSAAQGEKIPRKLEYAVPDSFYIRPNLFEALQQLRSEDNDVDIWVDALCINQSNSYERTAQVSRMNDIYSEATNVCIWLGAGTPETEETFEFLREILDLELLDRLTNPEADSLKEHQKKWLLVEKLMTVRWFSRRWVIQELALAKKATIRWGTEEMHWVNFSEAIALFMTKHDEIQRILSKEPEYTKTGREFFDLRVLGANELVNATSNLFRKSDDGKIQQRLISLEMLVTSNLLAFEAAEERDTIYAVLSIAQDTSVDPFELTPRTSWSVSSEKSSAYEKPGVNEQITHPLRPSERRIPFDPRVHPDYEKCLIDVYTDFMDFCVEKSRSLDIICRHWAPASKQLTTVEKLKMGKEEEEEEMKLPSWIPSIQGRAFGSPEQALKGRINGDSLVGGHERKNQRNYNASRHLLPFIEFGKRDNTFQNATLSEQDQAFQGSANQDASTTHQQKPKRVRKHDGTLYVRGRRISEIEKVSSRVSQGMIQQEALAMGGWPLNHVDPKVVPEKLWRTLVADRGPLGTNPPNWYHRACLECLAHADQAGDLNTTWLKDAEDTPSTMSTFLERVQRVIWNRVFFLAKADGRKSRKSLFGLAPPKAAKGDIICIFYGCSVPVLIRPTDDAFTFIGECYVHGMMDGEAIPVSAKQPVFPYEEAETFKLI